MTTHLAAHTLARYALYYLLALLGGMVVTLGVRSALQGDPATADPHAGPAAPAATPAADPHAGHAAEPGSDSGDRGILVELGNTVCPVMGGEPDGETFSDWNGLRVAHCCAGCTKQFLADPEMSLDEAGVEWREAAALVERARTTQGAERDRALQALEAAGHRVLRAPGEVPR